MVTAHAVMHDPSPVFTIATMALWAVVVTVLTKTYARVVAGLVAPPQGQNDRDDGVGLHT